MKRTIVILLSVLSGVCFGIAVSTHLLVTGSLNKNYRAYIVQSGSMAPALPVGSVVITKSEPNYGKGDIVTFSQDLPAQAGKTQITHRVATVEFEGSEPVFTTKGDANEEADGVKIKTEQIIGKSYLVIPYIGYLADFVRTPKGFVLLVVIPASIIVYEELKAVLRELKRLIFKKGLPNNSPTKAVMFVPIVGVAFLFLSGTGSFFLDNEASTTNVLGAAETFAEATPTFTPTPTAVPTPTPDLKINEFVANADTTFPNEWVEIYNNGPDAIDLNGWELADLASNTRDLSSLGSISPGNFVVFDDSSNGWLNNTGDSISLRDPLDVVIDTHTFGSINQNLSIGRDIDGTGAFKTCATPTKGTSNNGSC